MHGKVPILLSFYALSSESETLVHGQLTFSTVNDFTFKDYSKRKTFRTLLQLYRTKPYANQEIVLHFNKAFVPVTTDAYGSFTLKTTPPLVENVLQKVQLTNGKDVIIIPELYTLNVQNIKSEVIVISDIDDTLLHSFIYRKVFKLKTLMFTTMEKRKPVIAMQELLRKLTNLGASSFYVSIVNKIYIRSFTDFSSTIIFHLDRSF